VRTTEEAATRSQRQFWTIRGKIDVVDERGNSLNIDSLYNRVIVKTKPDPHEIARGYLKSKIMEGEEGDFPFVVLQIASSTPNAAPQFHDAVINLKDHLNSSLITIDRYHRTIELNEPIRIQALPRIGVAPGGAEVEDGLREEEVRSSPR
jgi:hypothetical protein